jgi:Zn-finger nucleic acid-binding protein
MTERQGGEIDHCPKSRGVWLDRGEHDKITERSLSPQTIAPTPNPPPNMPPGYGADHHGTHGQHGNYRRKSWLGELFD